MNTPIEKRLKDLEKAVQVDEKPWEFYIRREGDPLPDFGDRNVIVRTSVSPPTPKEREARYSKLEAAKK